MHLLHMRLQQGVEMDEAPQMTHVVRRARMRKELLDPNIIWHDCTNLNDWVNLFFNRFDGRESIIYI